MAMPNLNKEFLAAIDSDTKAKILESIATHYGKTPEQIFAEVTGAQSEHLLDYMVEPLRSATSILMQKRGMRGW